MARTISGSVYYYNGIDANSNTTSGANQPSDNIVKLAQNLEADVSGVAKMQESYYSKSGTDDGTGIGGVTDGIGGSGKIVYGTDSMFNPFYVFRFAKYGAIAGETYSADLHTDQNFAPKKMNMIEPSSNAETTTSPIQVISEGKNISSNPSASNIITWSQNSPATGAKETTVSPYPYQLNDFLWCKWYGKIPNNRLLTLRRYPIPVEDNIQVNADKGPLVPIAQAVTWWGEETGNSLTDTLGMTWGFKWKTLTSEVQDITGNEIEADKILDFVTDDPVTRRLLLATFFTNENNQFAGTDFDNKAQQWVRDSYITGPYWNRILGPINVIDSTQIRDRGYDWKHSIKLEFSYKLRTFNNINPKIAMLDLITNFLALTHNKAEFWGGGIRYFQKTGYIIPGLSSKKFEEGDFIGGMEEVITQMVALVQQKAGEAAASIATLSKGLKGAELATYVQKLEESAKSSKAIQNMAGTMVKDLMQKPLSIRSFLDGRATGEWHLTVGNPMNPLAVIGNLCLKSTTISFSESVGIDDFPTEVKFTVTLEHGRPRAKQDIESMFNLGGGDMSFTALSPPSSASNSLGEKNSTIANNFNAGQNGETSTAATDIRAKYTQSSAAVAYEQGLEEKTSSTTLGGIGDAYKYFTLNVARAYGVKWATSPAIPDYFVNLKTKD